MKNPRCEADRHSTVPPPLCLVHPSAECLPPRPGGTCNDCVRRRSRHEAPSEGASVKNPRCEADMFARCVLVSASGTRVQSACRLRSGTCNVSCNGAAMKLRQMEQACGCSKVQIWTRIQGACLSLPQALGCRVLVTPTRHLQCVWGGGAAMKLRLMEHVCGCSTVRGGQELKVCRHTTTRCLLVSAVSTHAAAPRCEADRDSRWS